MESSRVPPVLNEILHVGGSFTPSYLFFLLIEMAAPEEVDNSIFILARCSPVGIFFSRSLLKDLPAYRAALAGSYFSFGRSRAHLY